MKNKFSAFFLALALLTGLSTTASLACPCNGDSKACQCGNGGCGCKDKK